MAVDDELALGGYDRASRAVGAALMEGQNGADFEHARLKEFGERTVRDHVRGRGGGGTVATTEGERDVDGVVSTRTGQVGQYGGVEMDAERGHGASRRSILTVITYITFACQQ
ncbi:hypothetical protein GCM10009577_86900 [Streptomyces javensis]